MGAHCLKQHHDRLRDWSVVASRMEARQKAQSIGDIARGRGELLAIDAMHRMQAAGLQPTLRIDVLSEGEKRLISKGEQRTPQGGKNPEFVVWPFDGNQRIAHRDQLFTIMKRT